MEVNNLEMFGSFLYVKVQKDWRDNAAFLRESGYEGR